MPHVEKYAQLNDIITNTSNQPPTSKGRTLPPPGSPPFAPLPPKGSPEPGLYGTCLLAPHFVCEVSVYVFRVTGADFCVQDNRTVVTTPQLHLFIHWRDLGLLPVFLVRVRMPFCQASIGEWNWWAETTHPSASADDAHLVSSWQWRRFLLLHILCYLMLPVKKKNYSVGCVVVSYCGFNLLWSDDIWVWAPLNKLMNHLAVPFSAVHTPLLLNT